MATRNIPEFRQGQLEKICRILGEEMNGTKIGTILRVMGIPDPYPTDTKWRRLLNALVPVQNQFHHGNHTANIIKRVFDPVNWVGRKEQFSVNKCELNTILAFSGLELGDDGNLRFTESVNTLAEAEKRAHHLQTILKERNVHADVLKFCNAELLNDNYFHAVLEATKSVADKLRAKSKLKSDGSALATEALSLGKNGVPKIAINLVISDSEKSEPTGFMNLIIGLFGTFRNPTAHEPKIHWEMSEEDALDILGIVSLIHRKLDKSYDTLNYLKGED